MTFFTTCFVNSDGDALKGKKPANWGVIRHDTKQAQKEWLERYESDGDRVATIDEIVIAEALGRIASTGTGFRGQHIIPMAMLPAGGRDGKGQ